MKKMLIALVAIFSFAFANAQPPTWTTNTTGKCFCCDPYYNLPTPPPITGPTSVDCGGAGTYSTTACPGASIQWSISPAQPMSGATTSTMTVNPFAAGNYTITVSIRCGNKVVTSQIQVVVKPQECCTAAFLVNLQELPGGLYQITATPTCTSQNMHFWLLEEVTGCPGTSVAGGLYTWLFIPKSGTPTSKSPATSNISAFPVGGYGMQYTGLLKPKCYRLTHYFLCCGKWQVQSKCFCLTSTAKAKMSETELNPNTTTRAMEVQELPAQLKQIIKQQEDRRD
jgi:hypothetical protein